MKFIDINREFTAAANSYMAQGYYINAGTMGGSQGEVAHIDLTNGTEIIRVLLTTFNNYLGTEGVELIVGRVKDDIDQLEIFGEREYIETSKPKSMPGEEVNRWLMWERQNMK